MVSESFAGFPEACVEFLAQLRHNNDKLWFERRKHEYERAVLEPARHFILALGGRLRKIAPAIIADPRINKSIFKLHRDTRFSPDKTPFKTHLGIFLWEGRRKRMECSGFYFHLEPPELMLGAGIHIFPKSHLQIYRESVVHPRHGPALVEAVQQVEAHSGLRVHGKAFKKLPRGFEASPPFADFLLYNGLSAAITQPVPPQLHTPEIVDFCVEHFEKMQPLHRWLVSMTERLD